MKAVIDIETHDPFLKDFGDGSIRKDGRILGIGVYCPEAGILDYFDPSSEKVRAILADPTVTKIVHNGVYDLTWLINGAGLEVNGRIEDTMTREYLLDAYAGVYNLDAACIRRGIAGKQRDGIQEYWDQHKPPKSKGKAVEHLAEIPRHIVADYCKQDCRATYELFEAQQPLLELEGLLRANDIECRLYPLLMEAKKNGIGLDLDKREELSSRFQARLDEGMEELQKKYPFLDSLTAPTQLKKIWEIENIPLAYTESGNASFKADVLDEIDHPVAHKIKELRTLSTALSKFIDGALDAYAYQGRIHATLFPALRDEGGTITGRWSCRDPNMQNISAREEKFGSEMRSIFIPDEGCDLCAFDYKQIEYKVFLHYACGPGAEEAREKFRQDTNLDYHQMVVDMMEWEYLGKEGRHLAKNFNFGSIYGLGPRSFAIRFRQNLIRMATEKNISVEQLAKRLQAEYFRKVPFARPTMDEIQRRCLHRGYVRSLTGRRQRTPLDQKMYKVVNYLVQGSASDILKAGLVKGWEDGVFNVLHYHLPVHDENVFSKPRTKEGAEAAQHFHQCMMTALPLKIPLTVDTEAGPNWADVSLDYYLKSLIA